LYKTNPPPSLKIPKDVQFRFVKDKGIVVVPKGPDNHADKAHGREPVPAKDKDKPIHPDMP